MQSTTFDEYETIGGTTMRKVVAGLFVSLDGVVESPQTWQPRYPCAEATGA